MDQIAHSNRPGPSALSPDVVATLVTIGAATLYEAQGQTGALNRVLKPLDAATRLASPALTVDAAPGDNTAEVARTHLQVAVMTRQGRRLPVVFLQGFGSTKEDFADVAGYAAFDDRSMIAFNSPGDGDTDDGNIEGGLAPEDCFFSLQIVTHGEASPAQFVSRFIDRLLDSDQYSYALYAANLRQKGARPCGRFAILFDSGIDRSGRSAGRMHWVPCPRNVYAR